MSSQVHYLPLTPGLFSILVLLFLGLLVLIQLRILRYAYMRLGVGSGVALVLLFGSLIGSYFNIPITVLSGPPVRSGQVVEFFGMRYIVPFVTSSGTVLAVNVGGAVIPTLMSAYLMIRYQFWLKATIATAAIAVVIHSLATPVPGIGIAVPVFAPVVTTAGICAGRDHGNPCIYPLARIRAAARLYRRLDGDSHWRRSSQSRQDHRSWRPGRLDRRRGNIRRHFSHRHSCRSARRRRHTIAATTGLVSP